MLVAALCSDDRATGAARVPLERRGPTAELDEVVASLGDSGPARRLRDRLAAGDLFDIYDAAAAAVAALGDAATAEALCAALPRDDEALLARVVSARATARAQRPGFEVDGGWRVGKVTLPRSDAPLVLGAVDDALAAVASGASRAAAFAAARATVTDEAPNGYLHQAPLATALAALDYVEAGLVDDHAEVVFVAVARSFIAASCAVLARWAPRLCVPCPVWSFYSPAVLPRAATVAVIGRSAGPPHPDDTAELYRTAIGLWDPQTPGPLAHPDGALDAARALFAR